MSSPLLYEINTRCWLGDLSEKNGIAITLANVPASEFAFWCALGFTHIWLMGVWSTGPQTEAFSRRLTSVREAGRKLLPDFSEADIIGSPYAISGYQVSTALGGEAGLRAFRDQLALNGLKLVLDFIPNHTGLDHPWLKRTPELFVQSPAQRPETFLETTSRGPLWIAHGKDPYFPAWGDTAQLDYRNPATRAAMIAELKSIARLCDGVRCDMAMLVLEDVFAKTWSQFTVSSTEPNSEFWSQAISTIKSTRPDFLFLAEAYWDMETRLLDLGFDFAYDKGLTDRLTARRNAEVQLHLEAPPPLAARAYFLENHDEPRIASLLSLDEHRAAALLMLSLPGLRLLYQGQLIGATLRASIHLRRCPPEPAQPDIAGFYELLLASFQKTAVGHGRAELLQPTAAWQDNPTAQNIIAILWQRVPEQFDLVAVNLASHPSQCYVKLPVEGLGGQDWRMTNLLGSEQYQRNGSELQQSGLYLDLPAHAAQLFHCISNGGL